jgi:hypothetical protein
MKTNRFLLAVACATMAFTLSACSSDDKDDPTGKACYAAGLPLPVEGGPAVKVDVCMDTGGATMKQSECNSHEDGEPFEVRESCPPTPTLTCPMGGGFSVLVYGDLPQDFGCDDLPDD